jgi:BlaI family penicillinase repressor
MPRPRSEQPTPGELEVLQVLWREGPATVRQVMEALNTARPRAYTSVMSLLNVMVDKRLVRRRPQGRAFLYAPRVQRTSTLRKLVGELLSRAFQGSTRQLVMQLLEQTNPSPEELSELKRLIEEYHARKENQP